ncbi:MAG: tetratricopeptide repeat protein [Bacteriovoracaceae bacterium]|nr:tetratricopeptide repeat protein [Bacteriovoracaceae bacterium]
MKTFILATMTLFMFYGCSSSKKQLTTQQKKAQIFFSKGTVALIEKDYKLALSSLLEANKLDPENSNILTNLGMAYYFRGKKGIAIRYFEKASELSPNSSDPKVNLASLYLENGELGKAEALYKQVLKNLVYEKQFRTYYNLGIISLKKGDRLAAGEYFAKSAEEKKDYCPSLFQLGKIHYSNKKFMKALENFKAAHLGTCYKEPAPYYYRALTLTKVGKYDEAMKVFKTIQDQFPGSNYFSLASHQINMLLEKKEKEEKEEISSYKKFNNKDKTLSTPMF